MRQTAAKATRRDLRRALGPAAITALDNHASRINALTSDLLDLAKELAIMKQQQERADARLLERIETERGTADKRYALTVDHDCLFGGSLFARLRWLVKGC